MEIHLRRHIGKFAVYRGNVLLYDTDDRNDAECFKAVANN